MPGIARAGQEVARRVFSCFTISAFGGILAPAGNLGVQSPAGSSFGVCQRDGCGNDVWAHPHGAAEGLCCLSLGEGTVFGREGSVPWVGVTRVPASPGKPGPGLTPHPDGRACSGLTKGIPGSFGSITRLAKA